MRSSVEIVRSKSILPAESFQNRVMIYIYVNMIRHYVSSRILLQMRRGFLRVLGDARIVVRLLRLERFAR